jgi:mannose PTS system EIIA component
MVETTEMENAAKQVGVLVVTHGDFGESILGAAQLILGPQDGVEAISVLVSKGVEEIVESLKSALVNLETGKGIIILTDMFGGTPTTLSLSMFKPGTVEVVAGVNLPMLIKVLQSRKMAMTELVAQAREAGQKGVVVPGDMLRKKAAGA